MGKGDYYTVIKTSVNGLLIYFFYCDFGVHDLHDFYFSHTLRKPGMPFESQLECRLSNTEAIREVVFNTDMGKGLLWNLHG